MADVDINRLVWIVTGVQLMAELGDRPLAYRIEQETRHRLAPLLGPPPTGALPRLVPAVVSDVYYLNDKNAQTRPVLSIGGPGVNALSAILVNELPAAVAIENSLVVQMDVEMHDQRCAIWGMTHLETVRAIDLFLAKGYLDIFLAGIVRQLPDAGLQSTV